ncbi:hypothetical protein FIV07_21665 [Mycobacterium sp. THAF192]|nr:hypothetical protein FIV07_21665 [Mycobacterium sp. THAF192]
MTTAAPEPHDAGGCSDDAWRVLLLINDWIKHADAKTAGTLAAAGVSAGVLYSVVSDVHVLALPTTVCVAATGVCLLFAVVFGGLALRPRLWTCTPATSKVYFEHIARAYPKGATQPRSFVQDFTSSFSDSRKVASEVSEQIWAIAHIAAAKYRWVNLAMVFTFLAIVGLALTAFSVKYYS